VTTRSSVLVDGLVTAATGTVISGPPQSEAWIVKSLVLWPNGGYPAPVRLWVRNRGTGFQMPFYNTSIPTDDAVRVELWMVLEPLHDIAIDHLGVDYSFWISGARLPVGST